MSVWDWVVIGLFVFALSWALVFEWKWLTERQKNKRGSRLALAIPEETRDVSGRNQKDNNDDISR
jgi:hypothetical protein